MTPTPHLTAQDGFQTGAQDYARARPSYPEEALDFISQQVLESDYSKKVLDLGAGTGIMTKLLVERGFDVTAVEPVAGMRESLQLSLPTVKVLDGNSWSIPVESGSQDVVMLAQCFHWFDNIESLREIHRVLAPDGYIFLIWNMESKERSEWVKQLRSFYEVYDGSAPQYRTGKWKQAFDIEQVSSLFNLPLLHKRFQFDAPAVRSHVWARIKSKSYIAILDDKEKEILGQQVEKVLNNPEYGFPIDDSKEFIYPHDSDLYWIRKI